MATEPTFKPSALGRILYEKYYNTGTIHDRYKKIIEEYDNKKENYKFDDIKFNNDANINTEMINEAKNAFNKVEQKVNNFIEYFKTIEPIIKEYKKCNVIIPNDKKEYLPEFVNKIIIITKDNQNAIPDVSEKISDNTTLLKCNFIKELNDMITSLNFNGGIYFIKYDKTNTMNFMEKIYYHKNNNISNVMYLSKLDGNIKLNAINIYTHPSAMYWKLTEIFNVKTDNEIKKSDDFINKSKHINYMNIFLKLYYKNKDIFHNMGKTIIENFKYYMETLNPVTEDVILYTDLMESTGVADKKNKNLMNLLKSIFILKEFINDDNFKKIREKEENIFDIINDKFLNNNFLNADTASLNNNIIQFSDKYISLIILDPGYTILPGIYTHNYINNIYKISFHFINKLKELYNNNLKDELKDYKSIKDVIGINEFYNTKNQFLSYKLFILDEIEKKDINTQTNKLIEDLKYINYDNINKNTEIIKILKKYIYEFRNDLINFGVSKIKYIDFYDIIKIYEVDGYDDLLYSFGISSGNKLKEFLEDSLKSFDDDKFNDFIDSFRIFLQETIYNVDPAHLNIDTYIKNTKIFDIINNLNETNKNIFLENIEFKKQLFTYFMLIDPNNIIKIILMKAWIDKVIDLNTFPIEIDQESNLNGDGLLPTISKVIQAKYSKIKSAEEIKDPNDIINYLIGYAFVSDNSKICIKNNNDIGDLVAVAPKLSIALLEKLTEHYNINDIDISLYDNTTKNVKDLFNEINFKQICHDKNIYIEYQHVINFAKEWIYDFYDELIPHDSSYKQFIAVHALSLVVDQLASISDIFV